MAPILSTLIVLMLGIAVTEATQGVCASCSIGFSGDTCQIDDACVPIACENDGTCSLGVCTCPDGYVGDLCENIDIFQRSLQNDMALVQSTRIATIPRLEMEYIVSFEVRANSFVNAWQSVLHFTANDANNAQYGDRNPGIWFWASNDGTSRLHICSGVSGVRNNWYNSRIFPEGEWISVQVSQTLQDELYIYQIQLQGEAVLTLVNTQPEAFTDVTVYASDPWYVALDGEIRSIYVNPSEGAPVAAVVVSDEMTCQVTCDNTMEFYADDTLLQESADWTSVDTVTVPQGTSTISIACVDHGVAAGILVECDNGLVTDDSWECATTSTDDWESAYEIGNNGIAPWNQRTSAISGDAKWIWLGSVWRPPADDNLHVTCRKTLQGNTAEISMTEELPLVHSTGIGSLAVLPEEYYIQFDVKANSFTNAWQSVIHFTVDNQNINAYGSRNPAVWFHASGSDQSRLHICSAVSGNKNYCYNSEDITVGTWVNIQIIQRLSDGSHLYEILIDGAVVHSTQNDQPIEVRYAVIYAADPWHVALDGVIRNFYASGIDGQDGHGYDGQVRLIGGDTASEGRIEVYHEGQWGTVCDDYFQRDDANMVCQAVGYAQAAAIFGEIGSTSFNQVNVHGFGDNADPQPIFWDDVDCTNAATLAQCVNRGYSVENCVHNEDAATVCTNDCFEYDVDYMGADLNNGATTDVASAAECQTLCQNRDGCTHFTWVSQYFTRNAGIQLKCHLKNGMGERMVLKTGRVDATGLVSGPTQC